MNNSKHKKVANKVSLRVYKQEITENSYEVKKKYVLSQRETNMYCKVEYNIKAEK